MPARRLVCISIVTLLAGPAQADATTDSEPREPVTLYLNGSGVRLISGAENSRASASSLLRRRGLRSLRVPSYQGSAAQWNAYVDCVREQLADFRINVVDRRPEGGDYIMAVVGGSPQILGYSRRVTGVAGFSGTINRNSVVYVFERAMNGAPGPTCETTLQEFGHALGLDHTYVAADVMSYLPSRERKSFTDVDASCGEGEARSCSTGEATQNSYKRLAEAVGLRERAPDRSEPGSTEAPEATNPIPTAPRPPDADTVSPTLELISPEAGKTVEGDNFVQIVIWADDASGISNVELGWTNGDTPYVFSCDDMPAEAPVWCISEGNFYVFVLEAGAGTREFAVRVTDGAGNQTISEHRTIQVAGS